MPKQLDKQTVAAMTFSDRARRILGVYQARIRDPDVEQAWLRVSLCVIAFGYVWYLILNEGSVTLGLWMGLVASVGDLLVGGYMIWKLRRTKANLIRLRYLGIVSDNAALTIGMAGAGEAGVAMIGIYLWVTIGNGFRFGPKYLLSSYWLSLLGFGLQLLFVPFWQQHKVVGIGLFLAGAIVPLYVLVLLIRLTGQKDAAEQLSNAKSRFVANVSHELRTPLTGVYAVYDLLRSRNLASDDRELIGLLGNAIGTLKGSVDAVLQMSKLEAGAERAEKRPFNLWLLLHRLSVLTRPQSTQKGLSWELHIDSDVPASVWGDPVHLSHVLGNLLNNAFKFTSAGTVSLSASLLGEDRVRFEVTDTGIGIPADKQKQLFERFVQVDDSARRKYGGTGLGTSIARDLTELMGGTIGVVSAPGQGSTFQVDLPLCRIDIDSDSTGWGAWHRVLVVGDPCLECDTISQLLIDLGLEVVLRSPSRPTRIDVPHCLATLLVMRPPEAQRYSEDMLREHPNHVPPWVLVSQALTKQERSTFVSAGVAGIIDDGLSLEKLRDTLVPLLYRFELPSSPPVELVSGLATGRHRSLKLLLADDNASNRLLIARILNEAGHNVETVGRGDAAFDAMATNPFDLALLDLNMPDMSGPDVVKLFRAASVGGPRLPIIILSADATPVAKQESMEAGADEFLTKPIAAATLFAAIDRLLTRASAQVAVESECAVEPRNQREFQLLDSEQFHSLRRIARDDAKFLEQYVAAAFADAALCDAGLNVKELDAERIGVAVGTSLGGVISQEVAYDEVLRLGKPRLNPFTLVRVMYNGPASQIALTHGLSGPSMTFSTTCTSSTVAIGEAMRTIRHGYADTMIAGGSEAPFAYVAIKAWQALQVLAPADARSVERSCKPFSRDRNGTVLGEGAAFVVLEDLKRAESRGARIYAEIVGYGSCNDAAHLTQPSVQGQAKAMSLALLDANLKPDSIDYMNAHGTGTRLNDVTETLAIREVFRNHADSLAVSSTKSMHGHLIGAAGALELVISTLAIYRQEVPPTAHLTCPDPECDLDYVPNVGRSRKVRSALTSSFAVGGTSAALVLQAIQW